MISLNVSSADRPSSNGHAGDNADDGRRGKAIEGMSTTPDAIDTAESDESTEGEYTDSKPSVDIATAEDACPAMRSVVGLDSFYCALGQNIEVRPSRGL
ncbi:hypothetical protein [Nocardia colli]|uniref:hypothetical protein n=1 Tax=Nocardia colli TaxID=2545717 RepID=UPI0035E044EB